MIDEVKPIRGIRVGDTLYKQPSRLVPHVRILKIIKIMPYEEAKGHPLWMFDNDLDNSPKSKDNWYLVNNNKSGTKTFVSNTALKNYSTKKPESLDEVKPISNQNRILPFDKFVDKLLDKYIDNDNIGHIMEEIKERREEEVDNTHDIFRIFDENGWGDDVDVANVLLRLFIQTEK